MNITKTQETALKTAASRNGSILPLQDHIKGAAIDMVVKALKDKGLAKMVKDTLTITNEGYQAVGMTPPVAKDTRDCKKTLVLSLMSRNTGATVTEIADSTGWQTHTIRGFISTAIKNGVCVTKTRTTHIGTHMRGAPGSFTTYFAR